MKSAITLGFLLTIVSVACFATEPKAPVYFSGRANEAISEGFLFELKEQLRSSASMRLELDEEEAFHQLRVVSMDVGGLRSIAYSVTWTHKSNSGPVLMQQVIGTCPGEGIASCARTVLAQTSQLIDEGKLSVLEHAKGLLKSNAENQP